jgi:hypothetical protein
MSADNQEVQRIAEEIVVGHARHRRRTRWAVVAGAAVAVAAVVPLAIVLHRPATDGRPVAMRDHPTPLPPPTVPIYTPQSSAADDARIYAAVLRDWHGASASGAMPVYRRVCNSDGVCSAGVATAGLRQELTQQLGPRLHFVGQAVGSIHLQVVHVHGNSASAQIEEDCGRMCLFGERVHLTRAGPDWRLTGDAEQWIS